MAIEVVLKVREAEDAGVLAIKNANEKAKQILAEAEKEGSERYKAVIREARSAGDGMIRAAAKEADGENAPLEEKNAAEIKKILNPDSAKFEKAVEIVMERIVN